MEHDNDALKPYTVRYKKILDIEFKEIRRGESIFLRNWIKYRLIISIFAPFNSIFPMISCIWHIFAGFVVFFKHLPMFGFSTKKKTKRNHSDCAPDYVWLALKKFQKPSLGFVWIFIPLFLSASKQWASCFWNVNLLANVHA